MWLPPGNWSNCPCFPTNSLRYKELHITITENLIIKLIKVSLSEEQIKDTANPDTVNDPLTLEEIDEEVIISGLKKVIKIFKTAKNGKVSWQHSAYLFKVDLIPHTLPIDSA